MMENESRITWLVMKHDDKLVNETNIQLLILVLFSNHLTEFTFLIFI